jgi:sugar O-acyltransferase (sialic acid O-acetyltransferase NeuD family)
MKNKLIIFGGHQFAEMMKYYIERDTNYEVVAFSLDRKYIQSFSFCNLPVVPLDQLQELYHADKNDVLIALGYKNMNKVREEKYKEIKNMGYKIASYISSRAIVENHQLGEGNIVLENSIIGPFTQLGNGNIVWSTANIAHHNKIGNFNFIAMSSSIAGNVVVGDNCFIGNNATIKNSVNISSGTLIGAGTYISKDTDEGEVYVPSRAIKLDKLSSELDLR